MTLLPRNRLTVCALLLLTATSTRSQERPADVRPGVIEITTSLVELDAVVTDSRGQPVTNLTAGDFQVLQDGEPQRITVFSHVPAGSPVRSQAGAARPPLREDVRRTIAFVIDNVEYTLDLYEGSRTFAQMRRMLTEVFDRQLRQGDLMALFSLARYQGFEQFTADPEILKSLASGLKFLPRGSFRFTENPEDDDPEVFSRQESTHRIGGLAIQALLSIVEDMRGMPGRKSIVFFSTGISDPHDLSKLIDSANQAGITFYAIDPREPDLRLGVSEKQPMPLATLAKQDRLNLEPHSSLATLAKDTGGKAWGRADRIENRVADVFQDQGSYYVLGYVRTERTFDRRRHKIEVKVLPKGLRVRSSRTEFLGQSDDIRPTKRSADPLSELLFSPYRNSAVRATLTTFFTAPAGKPALYSAVFIDGRDLRATESPDGKYRGGVEMRLVAVNPEGEFSGQLSRFANFELDKEAWYRAQQTGLIFRLPNAGEKPGPYQIRLALREVVSGAAGSASTFAVIPDLKNGRLTASDIVLSPPQSQTNPHPLSNAAARTFVAGQGIAWMTEVYNTKAGSKKDGQLYKLRWKIRVLRDADLVYESPFASASAPSAKGQQGLAAQGILVTDGLKPGDYVLQVLVVDENVKNSQVSRFTDFHVIP